MSIIRFDRRTKDTFTCDLKEALLNKSSPLAGQLVFLKNEKTTSVHYTIQCNSRKFFDTVSNTIILRSDDFEYCIMFSQVDSDTVRYELQRHADISLLISNRGYDDHAIPFFNAYMNYYYKKDTYINVDVPDYHTDKTFYKQENKFFDSDNRYYYTVKDHRKLKHHIVMLNMILKVASTLINKYMNGSKNNHVKQVLCGTEYEFNEL